MHLDLREETILQGLGAIPTAFLVKGFYVLPIDGGLGGIEQGALLDERGEDS